MVSESYKINMHKTVFKTPNTLKPMLQKNDQLLQNYHKMSLQQ
jgi:hypothetical protein